VRLPLLSLGIVAKANGELGEGGGGRKGGESGGEKEGIGVEKCTHPHTPGCDGDGGGKSCMGYGVDNMSMGKGVVGEEGAREMRSVAEREAEARENMWVAAGRLLNLRYVFHSFCHSFCLSVSLSRSRSVGTIYIHMYIYIYIHAYI